MAGGVIAVAGQSPTIKVFNLTDGAPAGDVPAGADVDTPLYTTDDPFSKLPMLLAVTHDMAVGAAVTLVMRNIEPAIGPIAPLPNGITPPPTLPTLPESK